MSQMRILCVLGHPLPFPGAAWIRTRYFATYLSNNGCVITILSSVTPHTLREPRKTNIDNVTILNLIPTFQLIHPLVEIINALASLFSTITVLSVFSPKVVILSVPPGFPCLGAFLSSKLLGKKIVFDYRDEWEDYLIDGAKSRASKAFYTFFRKVSALVYARSDVVITDTPAHFRTLRRRGVRKILLVPNGADTAVFRPRDKQRIRRKLGLSPDDFIIVYCGYVGSYYRLDAVVDTLHKMMERNKERAIRLVLLGRGEIENVLGLASKLNLSENVIYLGVKHSSSEVAETIACADIAVIPYDDNPLWKNTYPAKFFEYCACGVPVIATAHRDSILADMIHGYKVGLAVSPMNALELERAFEVMLYDAEFRAAAGVRARKLIEEHFSRARIASNLLKILSSLVDR